MRLPDQWAFTTTCKPNCCVYMSSMKNVKSVKLTSSLAVLNEPTPPWRGILCVKGALTNDQYLVTSTTGHLLVILYWQRFFRNEEGVYRWIYYFDCDGSERTLNECKIRSVRENRDTCVKVMNVKCYNKTGESQESRNQTSLLFLSVLGFYDTMFEVAIFSMHYTYWEY